MEAQRFSAPAAKFGRPNPPAMISKSASAPSATRFLPENRNLLTPQAALKDSVSATASSLNNNLISAPVDAHFYSVGLTGVFYLFMSCL